MYRELQNLGSAAWLARYEMFALTRYDSVIRALKDDSAFSSASGVMMNDNMNRGAALASVAPDHAGNLRAAADGLNRTLVIRLCGAPDQPNQVTAGLSNTITLETKALTSRV